MESSNNKIRFRIPHHDLDELTFCASKPKSFKAWVENLPQTNLGETAKQLYNCLLEINRLAIRERERYELLEIVYPTVEYTRRSLSKHYLNQPIILPEKSQKVANLALALQSHLAAGYTSVAAWALNHLKNKETAKIATQSLYRAITCHSLILLRSYQLYFPTPKNAWKDLNQLYYAAEIYDLENRAINPEGLSFAQSNTIKQEYTRALLLATCKPNMLRQHEIALVFEGAKNWALWAEICKQDELFGLFYIDLLSDMPPCYFDLKDSDEYQKGDCPRSLFTADLVQRLKSFVHHNTTKNNNEDEFQIPEKTQQNLIRHLASTWDTTKQRSFNRTITSGTLEICVGLSALFFYVSNGKDFESQLRGGKAPNLLDGKDNPFLNHSGSPFKQPYREENKQENDVWALAYDAGGNKIANSGDFSDGLLDLNHIENKINKQLVEPSKSAKSYPKYECELVDTSPGGYCVEWSETIPTQIKAGEIIGLKESKSATWAIGVIRWIKHLPQQKARIGIQLLSPRAIPCGARVLKKTGKATEFMRALQLPKISAIGQDASLITPSITFKENIKIQINDNGIENKAQLIEQTDCTAGYSQFTYKLLEDNEKSDLNQKINDSSTQQGGDFDNLWQSL